MKIKNSKLFGAGVLLISGLLCKMLGALFRLPLTNLLGIEGIGMFQLVMSLYSFALVVTCGGVTNSLSKLISSSRAKGDFAKIASYLKRALFISIGIGLLVGILFLLIGKYIASLQGITSNNSYSLFIFLLPLGAGLAALRGFFQGYENMLPTAISQVVEQVAKFVFGLLFAFQFGKLGVAQGVFGAFVGITLSELISVVYLFVLWFFKSKNHLKLNTISDIKFAHKEFDKANFPLMLSASILPLVNAFDGLIIVPRLMAAGISSGLATKLFGIQTGVVGAVLNFPLIVSIAVTTTLLPNISYLISRGAGGRHIIEKGLRILLYLILPTTFGMAAVSRQVLGLVYGDLTGQLLNVAVELMIFGAFSIVFTAIMQYLIMLLQANGQFRFILFITFFGGLSKALISYLLSAIASINIFALVMGNIVLSAFVCIFALKKLKTIVNFVVSFKEIFTLVFGTLSMFVVVYAFINCNYFSTIANLLLGIILGVLVYFVLTIPFLIKIVPRFKKAKNQV